jgi:hypothetical protein
MLKSKGRRILYFQEVIGVMGYMCVLKLFVHYFGNPGLRGRYSTWKFLAAYPPTMGKIDYRTK